MKKSTIITVLAFTLGIVVLAAGFILLTPNNISNKVFPTTTTPAATTTTTPTSTTTTKPRPDDVPMDFFNDDISSFVTLGDYKGMTVEVDTIEVSDEEIDFEIGIILAQKKEFTKDRSEIAITEKTIFSFDFYLRSKIWIKSFILYCFFDLELWRKCYVLKNRVLREKIKGLENKTEMKS